MDSFTTHGGASGGAPTDMTHFNSRVRGADHFEDDDDMHDSSRARHSETLEGHQAHGVFSSNLRTLRTTNPSEDAQGFIRRYFSNLVGMKPGLVKMYFDKSCLTFNGGEFFGPDFIMMTLSQLRDCPFYNPQFISAQPTLGNGIFIIVKGNSPGHMFLMNFVIVNLKKKYRILNQYIEINPITEQPLPAP